MYFKQFYLGCLAHASYMIGSDGEAEVLGVVSHTADQEFVCRTPR